MVVVVVDDGSLSVACVAVLELVAIAFRTLKLSGKGLVGESDE